MIIIQKCDLEGFVLLYIQTIKNTIEREGPIESGGKKIVKIHISGRIFSYKKSMIHV